MKTKILPILMISFVVLSAFGVIALERTNTNPELAETVKDLRESELLEDSEAVKSAVDEYLPVSYEETVSQVEQSENESRFILWTNDGVNVMWGTYADNHFIGEDNNGKKAWGIYNKGFFAGFYDGEFFYGRYRGRHWKAYGLFGEEEAQGGLAVFPEDRPSPRSFNRQRFDRPLRGQQNLLNPNN